MSTPESQLSALLEDPGSSALLSDIDGTLCRIVDRPENAKVPPKATESLEILCERLGLVACGTGRPALVGREMVGVDGVTYFGNHGLELLQPGGDQPEVTLDPEQVHRAARFIAENDSPVWVEKKIRLEDKGPIQALHWRGAGPRTEDLVRQIADMAISADLTAHWGRKVLELRPPDMEGKAGAVEHLLATNGFETVVFAGDDKTDLEAVRRLQEMRDQGQIPRLLVVAVGSTEGPEELFERADVMVSESDEWIDLIAGLAESDD